jgi:hypothetical protein
MRLPGLWVLLFLSVWGISPLLAQEPAPAETSAGQTPATPTATDERDKNLHPVTPEQQREQQIRQFDPLDRTDADDKDAKEREKAARDEKKNGQTEAPLPGSIAAGERDAQRTGPRVAEGDVTDEPVQEYTGPAVLSRSYSVNRPLIPQELKWTESVGANAVYDSGVAAFNPAGTFGTSSPLGSNVTWSLVGRHYFRQDEIGVSYSGNYAQYSNGAGLSGLNNTLSVDYSHRFSRRLSANIGLTGATLSQNYALNNPDVGPGTTVANVNLGTSPNIQITDNGVKQIALQSDFVWQQSSRLSFDGGGSYFAVVRDTPGLLGMTGGQGHTDVNYRLTRKMTVGAYYSISHYVYSHGFGISDVNTVGAIYSYAFTRSLQLRLRGGISMVDSRGFQQIPVSPALATLLGTDAGIVDVASITNTSDISAQLIKDFGRHRTVNVAFAHGVAPGNGVFQASEQESISASFASQLFRRYNLQLALGYDTLVSVTEALGTYKSDYARISFARQLSSGITANLGVDLRHYDVTNFATLRNELRISTGISWSRTGRLLPF